jgi:hypothetical protein
VAARLRIGACLSLTGKFARFGTQAAAGLETWRSLTGAADVLIEDDGSDRSQLLTVLPGMAARCDLLLGPYSTVLMRAAGALAAEHGWLAWNHGGSGDDVQAAHPGHVVSVLTPASRYAEPFLRYVKDGESRELVVVSGPGRFGRQVTDGAMSIAGETGIRAVRLTAEDAFCRGREWDLLSAGVFEDDVSLVGRALRLARPPRRICAVAAGVREFSQAVGDPEGIFGMAQWFPGRDDAAIGPAGRDFLATYADINGARPDYPAVQAAASAVVALRCAQLAGSTRRGDLWAAAADLETATLFGPFGIDPRSGTQIKHQTVLLRWTGGELARP